MLLSIYVSRRLAWFCRLGSSIQAYWLNRTFGHLMVDVLATISPEEADEGMLTIENKDDTQPCMRCEGGCGKQVRRMDLWPMMVGAGWQGTIGLHCKTCYGARFTWLHSTKKNGEPRQERVEDMSLNQWKSRCKYRWAERKGISERYADRARRVTSWKKDCDDIYSDPNLKGRSNKFKRAH